MPWLPGSSSGRRGLAEDAWQGMERTFQSAVWLGWAKKIPSAVVYARPGLCVQLGWGYSDAGDLETSEIYLQHAEQALARMADPQEAMSLPATIALIRANNAQNQGDLAGSIQYAELCLQLAAEDNIYLPRCGSHHAGIYALGKRRRGGSAARHAHLDRGHAKPGQRGVCGCQRLWGS